MQQLPNIAYVSAQVLHRSHELGAVQPLVAGRQLPGQLQRRQDGAAVEPRPARPPPHLRPQQGLRSPRRVPPQRRMRGRGHQRQHRRDLRYQVCQGCIVINIEIDLIYSYCLCRARKLQQLYKAHEGPVTSMSFHPSGNFCVSGSADSKIKIYDLLQARTIFTLSGE